MLVMSTPCTPPCHLLLAAPHPCLAHTGDPPETPMQAGALCWLEDRLSVTCQSRARLTPAGGSPPLQDICCCSKAALMCAGIAEQASNYEPLT